MKAIRLRPSKKKTGVMLVGVALLFLVTLFVPGAFFVTPFLLPLLICPLMVTAENPLVFLGVASGLTTMAAMMHTGDTLLALAVGSAACAAPLVTFVMKQELTTFSLKHHRKYLMAYLFGMVVLVIWLYSKAQPQTIYAYLQQELTAWLQGTSFGDALVIRLAQVGDISMPESMKSAQENFAAIDPATMEQLYRSLAVKAEEVFAQTLPDWMVRVILAGSLFTLLRMQKHAGRFVVLEEKCRNQKKVVVVNPPGFSRLALPRKDFIILGLIYFATMIPAAFTSGTASTMLHLISRFSYHIIILAGAAAMIRMLSLKKESPAIWHGILAAVVWLLLPDILWLMVVLEPYIVIRNLMDKEEQK